MSKKKIRTLELLAPVKNYAQGEAALLCGADALYVGAPRFGARAAAGVDCAQIGRLSDLAHGFGARVYVTMNTLLYEEELAAAQALAHEIWQAGADALIIQDMSFLRMELPPIELHASTQLYNCAPERVRFLADVGFSRVVTERALSLEEVASLSAAADIEIESFVHGAICVSFSGRCYLSRTMSARSGNRGDCSQVCRLPYTLVDENNRVLQRNRHLLSVQDMNQGQNLEAMIDAGVVSFKIEGRLKDETYVRNVVSWYRQRLDEIIARREDLCRLSLGESRVDFEPDPAKSFSRGATSYYLTELSRTVASFETPKSFGELLGEVRGVRRDSFALTSGVSLAPGDGLCFADEQGKLIGTNVNRVEGERIWPNRMDGIRPGILLYRNLDHRFVTAVNRSRLRRSIPVEVRVEVSASAICVHLCEGESCVTLSREGVFQEALQPVKSEEALRVQFTKMGDTLYRAAHVLIAWSDGVRFVPLSLLGELRREAIEQLDQARRVAYHRRKRRKEHLEARFPQQVLSGEENVVNSLAERFYRDHGVEQIETGNELRTELTGCRVMQMRYCLRRELGECLREGARYRGRLFLEHGLHRYELRFDCARCRMELYYQGQRKEIRKNRDKYAE